MQQSPIDPRFRAGTVIGVFGQSRCGKTTFLLELVRHCDRLFDPPPVRIAIYARLRPEQYRSLAADRRVRIADEPFPYTLDNPSREHLLCVVDDAMCELGAAERQALHRYVTGECHHSNVTLALSMQQIYLPTMRTIRLNVEHHIFFACCSDRSTVYTLGRQLYPNKYAQFYEIYADATREPYQYLHYCSAPYTDDRFRLRSRVTEIPSILYEL